MQKTYTLCPFVFLWRWCYTISHVLSKYRECDKHTFYYIIFIVSSIYQQFECNILYETSVNKQIKMSIKRYIPLQYPSSIRSMLQAEVQPGIHTNCPCRLSHWPQGVLCYPKQVQCYHKLAQCYPKQVHCYPKHVHCYPVLSPYMTKPYKTPMMSVYWCLYIGLYK